MVVIFNVILKYIIMVVVLRQLVKFVVFPRFRAQILYSTRTQGMKKDAAQLGIIIFFFIFLTRTGYNIYIYAFLLHITPWGAQLIKTYYYYY
jgi:hypothetical protein